MALNFAFYSDAGLTTPITVGLPANITLQRSGISGNVDTVVYFGCGTSSLIKAQAQSNPGVDPIIVSVVDGATGSGQPAGLLKVSLTQGATGATGSVSLGANVPGGVVNAVPVWIRANMTDGVATPGVYTDLSLSTNEITEVSV